MKNRTQNQPQQSSRKKEWTPELEKERKSRKRPVLDTSSALEGRRKGKESKKPLKAKKEVVKRIEGKEERGKEKKGRKRAVTALEVLKSAKSKAEKSLGLSLKDIITYINKAEKDARVDRYFEAGKNKVLINFNGGKIQSIVCKYPTEIMVNIVDAKGSGSSSDPYVGHIHKAKLYNSCEKCKQYLLESTN